jgi:glycosyltransferase involved in cell wall biosynthesis
MASVTLVVPCFNEERRLDVGAFERFSLDGHDLRFAFVNDGSTDRTLAVLEGIRSRAKVRCEVVDVQPNQGKAEAVRRGVLHAIQGQPAYVGFWDADLAAPLAAVGDFVELMDRRREIEMVFGSRVRLMGRSIERLAWRHYLGRFSATLVSQMLALPIYDTQCGHKLFRRTPLLERVFSARFTTNWLFDVEIIARFLTMDPRGRAHVASMIYEWPLTRWVDVRGSKVKPTDFLKSLQELARIQKQYPL